MNDFISKLSHGKIEINWNKNPIKMDLFLSFLTVKTDTSANHLGYNNGWIRRNGDNGLIIGGGWANGIAYLDDLQYGKKLHNKYNNYVNPFYLFDILNKDGKDFFVEYYKEEIDKILKDQEESISFLKEKLEIETETQKQYSDFVKSIRS